MTRSSSRPGGWRQHQQLLRLSPLLVVQWPGHALAHVSKAEFETLECHDTWLRRVAAVSSQQQEDAFAKQLGTELVHPWICKVPGAMASMLLH